MKKTLLYILLALSPLSFIAQQKTAIKENLLNSSPLRRCGTFEKMQEIRALDPAAYDKNQLKQEQLIQNWIANNYNSKAKVVYTIPVVVQIFGATPNSSVTDNRVNEQLAVLNQDYRRLNTDAGNTPSVFQSIAADSEIEFCLATLDPQGNPTTGIVRKTSVNTPGSSDLWNTSQYLNLFVYTINGGVLGFTYLPSQAPNNAVHIGYQYFGKTGASSPFNKGRTATHEIGHWFNLEHIWADESACNADDGVSDTPQQKAENYGCPSYPQTTQSGGRCLTTDPSSMYMNYMDYTDDACMNMFSAGQKARMISAINTYRSGLLNNGKCGTVNPVPPVAAFTANSTTIAAGSCVNFSDQSTFSPTSWAWTFQGAATLSSTQQNPSNICYNDSGCFDVTLVVFNADGGDTLVKTCYINVVPQGSLPCDTVSSYKPTDTPTLLGSGGWGYVTGHNDYDDRAKAEYFTAPPAGFTIEGAKFWFAKAYAGSPGSSVDIKIWADNGGTPGTAIYSQTVPMSSLLIYPLETFINFTSPQTVTGNYFLGVEFSANGNPQDTVALISNAENETSPGTGWELWSDATWHAISEPSTGWGINLSQAIWALRCPNDSTTSNPPTAVFTADNISITEGSCVNFTNQSTGSPTSSVWIFQGAVTGSSTQQNPSNICYNDTGCFDVTLIVTNADGSDTLTKACYINVTPELVLTTCDTVSNYKPADTPTLLGSGGWGYVTGHNDYDDRAKADFFTALPAGFTIEGGKFWFAKADAGSPGSSVDIKIWADNSGTPGTAVYSQTVPISSLQVYPVETFIMFTSPQTVTGNYYLGVQFSANGSPQDTIALMSNADNQTNPGTAWELWSDGSWHPISEPNTGWGINISQGIWALRCPEDSGVVCNVAATTTSVTPACSQSNGSITVIPSGGISPYTYLWNNAQTTGTATGLAANNYQVTITDSTGCQAFITASLANTNGPSVSVNAVNASAYGVCDGSATATVSAGTTPYTYLWSNSATIASISGLCAGTYDLTVTDFNDCKATSSVTISEPVGINSSLAYDTEFRVFPNPSNGKITVTTGNFSGPVSVNIYNVIGERIISEKRGKISGSRLDFDLSNQDKGVYFIEIITKDKTSVKKISVLRQSNRIRKPRE